MKPALYDRVTLRRDLDEHGLKREDVATLVDFVPHPLGGEDGVILEVFNAIGESTAIVTVKESEIESLRADEILAVRPLPRIS
ncbi:DUF4926 domain-containing protein [Tautonia plasticadhaerens]|uniref:DUF4926 domain-containing protein n=1 Tax=Tautonia plasticadhaerens TaxID=2527974 RepID=A0A518HCG1_9BACT|nr:DUF4926 domain-containing protein [Tautonia plasticadhaerens]QDV38555.1 hypothetical protein ElP_65100 [Tautonia plasticadhaerens]